MDTMIEWVSSTGFTNLLMFTILILLYRVLSLMKWSKVTLNKIEPNINFLAHNEVMALRWDRVPQNEEQDKELGSLLKSSTHTMFD